VTTPCAKRDGDNACCASPLLVIDDKRQAWSADVAIGRRQALELGRTESRPSIIRGSHSSRTTPCHSMRLGNWRWRQRPRPAVACAST